MASIPATTNWHHPPTPGRPPLVPHAARARAWVSIGALIIGLGLAVPAAPAGAAPLIDCASSDNGDPILTGITLSTTAVDVTQAGHLIRITATADDTGGPGPAVGLRRIDVGVNGPRDSFKPVTLAQGASGNWTGTFRVRKWEPGGTWRIHDVDVTDRVGQTVFYGFEGRNLGAIPGTHAFTVTSVVDPTPPQLTAVSFRRHRVNTTHRARYVRVTARAVDRQTGIAQVVVAAIAPDETAFPAAQLRRVPGTAHQYRGRIRMPRFIPTGRWPLLAIVANRTDRYRFYGPGALSRLGAPRALTVRSSRDRTRPILKRFHSRPSAVDVRTTGQALTVTLRARDADSGVGDVSAGFWARDVSVRVRMHLVSGTRHDGVWQGTARVDRCPSQSGVWHATVHLFDHRGNQANYGPAALRDHGWTSTLVVTAMPDTLPPTARLARETVPNAGPVVLNFNQAVNGISASSAPVHRVNPNTLGHVSGPIDGTWTCRNGAGTLTDCGTGRVRKAVFRPSQPFPEPGSFEVALNPEHNLDITDLAGNPCDRDPFTFSTAGGAGRRSMPSSRATTRYGEAGCLPPFARPIAHRAVAQRVHPGRGSWQGWATWLRQH